MSYKSNASSVLKAQNTPVCMTGQFFGFWKAIELLKCMVFMHLDHWMIGVRCPIQHLGRIRAYNLFDNPHTCFVAILLRWTTAESQIKKCLWEILYFCLILSFIPTKIYTRCSKAQLFFVKATRPGLYWAYWNSVVLLSKKIVKRPFFI